MSLKGGISAMEYLNTLEAAQKGKKGAAEKLAKYVENGMIRTTTYDELIEKYGVIPAGEKPKNTNWFKGVIKLLRNIISVLN